jgi:octanoyl-[GcvH]:protein N-octanoyltransferase
MDTAISRALLNRVAEGAEPESLRIHRPGAIVAFGPKDRLEPGYRDAIGAAAGMGFGSVQRLAGGRAAVFHEDTIAFSWAIPDPTPREGIRPRFEELAAIMAEAFRSLGVDARVGEVPGEYCPGEHSVNARGKTKLMGVGQRVVSGAAHVGGVVVVRDGGRVRDVLIPVYDALGLTWDPATAGSLADEAPGVTWEDAERAIAGAFSERFELYEAPLSDETLALAEELAPSFVA